MFDGINLFFANALKWINSWVGNYGWSVVIFTFMIRLVLLPLTAKSRKGMRSMTKVQPKMQELQKKYGNDKEKLNKKMMELYQKEHVSPTSGCLPMLLQWPILLLMFTAMRVVANEHTIQMLLDLMNNADVSMQGWLWIKNVFQPDSFLATILPAAGSNLAVISPIGYSSILTQENIEAARAFLQTPEYAAIAAQYGANAFVQLPLNFLITSFTVALPNSFYAFFHYANGLFILPILAGVSQFLMTKLTNPEQKQPEGQQLAQQNDAANAMNSGFMKWFFPLFSVWICASSNSAFSIYWMTVNIISILETVVLNKVFDMQDAKAELKAGKRD
ncbi:MAG: YidC/Oxa1 family membrane protein insertase [Clostridia bacterium]|nr:YidC/Oxa1 family membrane protein insertase [Clostridia bacterium]